VAKVQPEAYPPRPLPRPNGLTVGRPLADVLAADDDGVAAVEAPAADGVVGRLVFPDDLALLYQRPPRRHRRVTASSRRTSSRPSSCRPSSSASSAPRTASRSPSSSPCLAA